MKQHILTLSILASLGISAAAHADSISIYQAQSQTATHSDSTFGGQSYSSAEATSAKTTGIGLTHNAGPGQAFGLMWQSSAVTPGNTGSNSSGDGVIVGYSINPIPLGGRGENAATLRGSLSLGITRMTYLGTETPTLGTLGYSLAIGSPAASGYIRHVALKYSDAAGIVGGQGSGAGDYVATPVEVGFTGQQHGISYRAAVLIPQYHLAGGLQIAPGWEIGTGYQGRGWTVRAVYVAGLALGATSGDQNTPAAVITTPLGRYGVRSMLPMWPTLPSDPAASYQRGLTVSGSYAMSQHLDLTATAYVSRRAQSSGGDQYGDSWSQSSRTLGGSVGLSYQF